jgi:hypothetical protein
MKVQLLACNTGRELPGKLNFAQQLAKILHTIVQSANNFVWFKPDGSYDIAGVNASGTIGRITLSRKAPLARTSTNPEV